MALHDLTEFLDDSGLKIALGGREYLIPAPDALTGLKMTAIANIAAKVSNGQPVSEAEMSEVVLDDADETNFARIVLGDTLESMIEDGLDWVVISRTAQFAFVYFAISEKAAAQGLANGVFSGKAVAPAEAPNRAVRRATTPKGRPASAGTRKAPQTRVSRPGTGSSNAGN